jgi:hypothetical protein
MDKRSGYWFTYGVKAGASVTAGESEIVMVKFIWCQNKLIIVGMLATIFLCLATVWTGKATIKDVEVFIAGCLGALGGVLKASMDFEQTFGKLSAVEGAPLVRLGEVPEQPEMEAEKPGI